MSRENSQRTQILQYMKTHKSITPIEALNLCGCFRLAAVIWRLREDGYDIETHMVGEGQKQYAEYRLSGESHA